MAKEATKWISCYIFHTISFEKVLTALILPLRDELNKKKLLSSYFFIRYWENGPHIRLRIQPSTPDQENEIKKYIAKRVETYFRDEETSDYRLEFSKYIRETNRYGGLQTMLLSEKQFEKSSDRVLSLLKDHHQEWEYSTGISYAIQLHILLLKQLSNINIEDAIDFFEFVFKHWLGHSVKRINDTIDPREVQKVIGFFETSYQNQKDKIDTICQSLWNNEINDPELNCWSDHHTVLQENISKAYDKNLVKTPVWMNFEEKTPVANKNQVLWPIYDSLVHMTNNRLGIHLRDEAFIAYLIVNGLKSIK